MEHAYGFLSNHIVHDQHHYASLLFDNEKGNGILVLIDYDFISIELSLSRAKHY
jgi:hypothetical protein